MKAIWIKIKMLRIKNVQWTQKQAVVPTARGEKQIEEEQIELEKEE